MLVQRFVEWSRTAPVEDRARAVEKVCKAWAYATVPEGERRTSIAVMTVALDDPSPKVRLALATAIAPCADAPRHIVLTLARDLPAIAAQVLNASPLLTDAELVPFVEAGDEACALAVASRTDVSMPLARAVIAHGGAAAVTRLMDHPAVVLGADALRRIALRFGDEAAIRTRLLVNDMLGADIRRALAAAHAASLYAFAAERNWLSAKRGETLAAEARERNLLNMALDGDAAELVADAIAAGHMTAALLVRAAVEGQTALVEHAIAQLSDHPVARVAAALRAARSHALSAILLRAGIGRDIGEMIAAAHRIWVAAARHAHADAQTEGTRVLRHVVRTLQSIALTTTQPAVTRLLADLELQIERHAALQHEEQVLIAA